MIYNMIIMKSRSRYPFKKLTAVLLAVLMLTLGVFSVNAAVGAPESAAGFSKTVELKIPNGERRAVVVSLKTSSKVGGLLIEYDCGNTGIAFDISQSKSLIDDYGSVYPHSAVTQTRFSVLFPHLGYDFSKGEQVAELVFASYQDISLEKGAVDLKVIEIYDPDCNEITDAQWSFEVKKLSTDSDTDEPHVHTEVIDPAVEATCTQTGKTKGSHCSVCGEVIKAQQTIPMKDHTPVTDAAVEATCTQTGKTEGSHCSVCGKVIKAQEIIPVKEHNFVNGVCTNCGAKQTGAKEYTYGDANSDGVVDSGDALLILRFAVGLTELAPVQLTAADVDKNGSPDSSDALEVLRYSLGYPSKTAVGGKFSA